MLALTYALKARNRFAEGRPPLIRYQIKSIASLGALCQSLYGSRGRDEKATILRLNRIARPFALSTGTTLLLTDPSFRLCLPHSPPRTCALYGANNMPGGRRGPNGREILSFDYSSDVMAIAEEAHFSVENKTTSTVTSYGWASGSVQFILQNKYVNGGAPTVKHRGVIVRRNPNQPLRGQRHQYHIGRSRLAHSEQRRTLWMRLQRQDLRGHL